MVVFTCNHCGESLQKPRVEKHYFTVCKRNKSLSCVDCFKDFLGEEYDSHTKCITEEERYAAKGTFQKPVVKKGEIKQESWTEMIRSIMSNDIILSKQQKGILSNIAQVTNVPRKRNKFINFIKSSTGNRAHDKDIEAVWDVIEQYKSKTSNSNTDSASPEVVEASNQEEPVKPPRKKKKQNLEENVEEPLKKKKKSEENSPLNNNLEETNGNSHNGSTEPTKKKKKKSIEENELSNKIQELPVPNEQEQEENVPVLKETKFSFEEKILEILQKKRQILYKKLEKKVLNAYRKQIGREVTEKLIKKFNKKLRKIQSVEFENDTVKLIN